MIEWPAGLPYQSEAAAGDLRPSRAQPETEMEGGDVRLRDRPGDRLRTVPWSRRFLPEQYAQWSAFLEGVLKRGTLRFLVPVWTGAPEGDGYSLRLVQIVGGAGGVSETPTGRGLHMRVSFSLLVFPAEMVPAPKITLFDYFILGTGTEGQAVEIEIDGTVRSATVSGGRFVMNGADLTIGVHSVRSRYEGGVFSPAQSYTISPAAGGHFDALSSALYDVHMPRRVLTAWKAAVIRARRFDSVERDFFGVDVAPWLIDSTGMSLAEWAGIGPAYVAKCYGQKGDSHDAVQAAGAAQPRIVNAGVLDVGPNGRPMMVFSGAQYFDVQNSLGFLRNAEAVTLASLARSSVNAVQVVMQPVLPVSPVVHAVLYYVNATTLGMQGRSSTTNPANATATATIASGAWVRHVGRIQYSAGVIGISANGVTATTAMTPAQNTPDIDATVPLRYGANATLSSFLTGASGGFVSARGSLDLAALDAALAQVMP